MVFIDDASDSDDDADVETVIGLLHSTPEAWSKLCDCTPEVDSVEYD